MVTNFWEKDFEEYNCSSTTFVMCGTASSTPIDQGKLYKTVIVLKTAFEMFCSVCTVILCCRHLIRKFAIGWYDCVGSRGRWEAKPLFLHQSFLVGLQISISEESGWFFSHGFKHWAETPFGLSTCKDDFVKCWQIFFQF